MPSVFVANLLQETNECIVTVTTALTFEQSCAGLRSGQCESLDADLHTVSLLDSGSAISKEVTIPSSLSLPLSISVCLFQAGSDSRPSGRPLSLDGEEEEEGRKERGRVRGNTRRPEERRGGLVGTEGGTEAGGSALDGETC